MMAGMDLGSRAIREQIASAIQLIVYQQRLKDGTRRFTHVTEVAGMEGEVITLQDIFLFDFSAGLDEEGRFRGRLKSTGLRPKFLDKLAERGVYVEPGAVRAGSRRVGSRCSQRTPSSRARRCSRSSSRSSRWPRSRSGGSCSGTAARVKADRDMAARMARDRPPGAAGRRLRRRQGRARGWIPESVSTFGERFAAVAGVQREARRASSRPPGVSLRSGEFVVATVGAGLLGAVLGAALLAEARSSRSSSASSAPRFPTVVLRSSLGRRGDKMREQLPDVLDDHGVVAAGGALASSRRSTPSRRRSRSRRTPSSSGSWRRSGSAVPPRMPSRRWPTASGSADFRWAVLAVNIQREVGGNLAEILDNVSDTLRERAMMRRQIKVLTAEGRLSAWVLALLPFGIAIYMFAVNPDYISLAVHDADRPVHVGHGCGR